MKKIYEFNYAFHEAHCSFVVDTEKFTAEIAQATLDFFAWDYDEENDPVDEVMNKYAIRVLEIASFNEYNEYGVISEFETEEGYCRIDGSMGILLTYVSGLEFHNSELGCEIKEYKS